MSYAKFNGHGHQDGGQSVGSIGKALGIKMAPEKVLGPIHTHAHGLGQQWYQRTIHNRRSTTAEDQRTSLSAQNTCHSNLGDNSSEECVDVPDSSKM